MSRFHFGKVGIYDCEPHAFFLLTSKCLFLQGFYEKKHPDSFYVSTRPLMFSVQICGLLPVRGILDCTLRFTWRNSVHIYGFVIFVISLFFNSCYAIDNFKSAVRIDIFASTVFYTVCLLTMISIAIIRSG